MSLAGDTALNALLKCINLSVYGQYVDLYENKSMENVVCDISLKAPKNQSRFSESTTVQKISTGYPRDIIHSRDDL